jgi:hypothetical protein
VRDKLQVMKAGIQESESQQVQRAFTRKKKKIIR